MPKGEVCSSLGRLKQDMKEKTHKASQDKARREKARQEQTTQIEKDRLAIIAQALALAKFNVENNEYIKARTILNDTIYFL